jgi:hypothetical protein
VADVQDIDDAAAGAAAYLCALNVHEDVRSALNAYNSGDPTGRAGGAETRDYTPAVIAYAERLDAAAPSPGVAAGPVTPRRVVAHLGRQGITGWAAVVGLVEGGEGERLDRVTGMLDPAVRSVLEAMAGEEATPAPASPSPRPTGALVHPLAVPVPAGERHHSYPAADLPSEQGAVLLAPQAGRVATIDNGRCGLGVVVQAASGWRWVLCHLSAVEARDGDTVAVGQRLGLTGGQPGSRGAGRSTGPHLHLELHSPAGEMVCPQATLARLAAGDRLDAPVPPWSGCSG